LIAELPGSAALATGGSRPISRAQSAAVGSTAIPPRRIPVKEPARPGLTVQAANLTRPKPVQAVRPASGTRVTGPPMLRPADFDRILSAVRRRAVTTVRAQPMIVVPRAPIAQPKASVPVPGSRKTLALPSDPTASGTGINPWWRYQEQSVPGGGHLMVNVGTGNLLLQDDDMSVPHKGIALAFRRTYNSQSSASSLPTSWGNWQSLYGNGWTNTFDARLVSQSATIKSVYDIDGARYDYSYNGGSTMTSLTPGQHATMVFDGGCGWLWTKKSGTTYYFYTTNPNAAVTCPSLGTIGGYSGRLYQIIGRNRNTVLTFNYYWDNGDASLNGKINTINATTESGQTASLRFADFNGRRLLQMLVYPDNTTVVYYGYDAAGNLTGAGKPANNAQGTVRNQWYGYQTIGSDSVMSYAASPRWVAGCANGCGSDGNVLYFWYGGSTATTSALSAIQHRGVVNPAIADGTPGSSLQPGYTTADSYYLTEYYTTGVTTPTYRDTDGHMTNWVVDGIGRPTQTQECTATAGQGTQCTGTWLQMNETWDANNELTVETDVRGNETDYAYDANGDTIAVALPAVTVSTPNGLATFRPTQLYDYDGNYNVTAYCDARATHLSGHDWAGTGPTVSDSLCSSGAAGTPHATFAFTPTASEPFGELTTITSPLGYSRHLAYNPPSQGGTDFGLPTDVSGDTIAQADGTSRQPYARYTYDQAGNVICVAANANDQTTVHALAYDGLNRLMAVADPDDASMAGCTRTPGLPGSTIITRTTYFADGSKATTQTPSEAAKNVATQYTYDPDGDEVTETHHFGDVGATTTKWYDGNDRLIEVSQPRDTTDTLTYPWMTRYFYDLSAQGAGGPNPVVNGTSVAAYGNLFKTVEYMPPTTVGTPTNYLGTPSWVDVRGTGFDALDRGTASYEAAFGNGPKESRAYDAAGQAGLLSQVTNAVGQVKTLAYDQIGRPTAETFSGDVGVTPNRTIVYDVTGQPSSIATTDLGAETYSYDAEGRETSKVEPAGGSVVDAGTIGHTYYGDGLLKTTTLAATSLPIPVSTNVSYRADGRLSTKTLTDVNGNHAFGWTYTGGGRVTRRTDPLTGALLPAGVTPNAPLVPQSYAYDASGQLKTMTIPRNASYTSMAHDAEGETTGFDAYQNSPSAQSWHQSMTYTTRSELASEVLHGNTTGRSGSVHHSYAFGINFGRGQGGDFRSGQVLTRKPSTNLSFVLGYDTAGRLQRSASTANLTGGQETGSYTRAYDANNHLRSETISSNYVSALEGCCAAANTEYPMTSSYWPDGHAANVSSFAFTGTLHWDGDQLLYTGNTVYVGTDAIIVSSTSDPTTLVYDRDWSGTAVTSHWSAGGIAEYGAWADWNVTVAFNPNGSGDPNYPAPPTAGDKTAIPTGDFPIPHPNRTDGYAIGQVMLQGVRAYDPATNQFITPDAYAGDVHDPMSQKPFMWNRNNPYVYSDPTGYYPDDITVEASGRRRASGRGSGGSLLDAMKKALEEVWRRISSGGSLPKSPDRGQGPGKGKMGSPTRGDSIKGYRLDPGHPGRAPSDPESGPHFNYWDYTKGKKDKGGVHGAIPIKTPEKKPPQ
jgi:YD repeat-containing protein